MIGRTTACALLAVAVAGCHPDGVILTVGGRGMVADQLAVTARYAGRSVTQLRPAVASATPLDFPVDLFADFGGHAVDVVFTVEALEHGQVAASAALPSLHVGAHQLLDAEIDLTPPPVAPPPDDLALPPSRPSYASVVLADAPLAYYRLDEPAGATVAVDASPNHLDGSYGAGVTRGAPGLITDSDVAARFNGGNWSLDSIVAVPRSLVLEPTAAVSIELWLQPFANNPDFATLIDYGDSGNVNHEPPYGAIIIQNTLGTLLFTDGGSTDLDSVTEPALQHTYHYVQTYDGSALKLYVDGVLEAEGEAAGLLDGYGQSGLGIGGTSVDTSSVVFTGTLDEVAIYGVALTPQQVLAHYAAGTAP
ncbi:MAG TPA: LamG domain-containing protein [Polyangia bacterium]|jgi:hypothetical protein|nr:LamG domain-containing protein [Polyangia bacterium]